MDWKTAILVTALSVFVTSSRLFEFRNQLSTEERIAQAFMATLDNLDAEWKNRVTIATWDYESNLTDFNQNNLLNVSLQVAEKEKEAWKETLSFFFEDFKNETLRRMFEKYSKIGEAALSDELHERYLKSTSNMQANYAKATICSYQNASQCDLHVEPEVTEIFASSRDAAELKHTWVEWHNKAGFVNKADFIEYVKMKNEAAKLNGYSNGADWWVGVYEDAKMENQFLELWKQVKPLYEQVHAYVRRHLRNAYGSEVVSEKGPIPAHLLGNIWAQSWSNILDITKPFPNSSDIDVTAALIKNNYTSLTLFQMANDFFKSLNQSEVPQSFWDNSIIEKPADRDMVCHASAWDFYDGKDFRIKQCTKLTSAFLKTTHHEMGHIQYYMQYKDQPTIFKDGANPGFHEAVGDVIALSVMTPKHLHAIHLLDEIPTDPESQINELYKTLLEKVIFLPFAYMLDLWRYGVFRGTTTTDDYNCHYWALREGLQGLEPPVNRSEANFDAVAKYHVAADVEYMRYYIAHIVQFQFHRSLCKLAGQYAFGDTNNTLSNCDIYGSHAAGNAFSEMLKLGSSKPWPEAMKVLTDQSTMDASGLLEYFAPIYDGIKADNEKNGVFVGWEESKVQYCTGEQKNRFHSNGMTHRLRILRNI